MPRARRPLADRFWDHVRRGASDECWEWQSDARTDAGYGVFQMGRGIGTRKAHQVAWELTHGDRGGRSVLHSCDNPPCCNPGHLRLGDHDDNMRDMAERGRSRSAKVTHCPANHPYDEENTYVEPSTGRRRCRRCIRQQKHERHLDPAKAR